MTLRLGRLADAPGMLAIERTSFSDPWSLRSFEKLLSAPHAHIVVDASEQTIDGFVVLLLAADEAEIANIAVAPARRGTGLGRTLLATALEEARVRGVRSVFLEVRPSNTPALALYRSAGFAEVGRRRRYYAAPVEDALVMSAALAP
ncbi:MAG: ribosomal protein S18-alanine N-acetyltransferase [Gemmatimonadaceae bacterium]|jgi:ribosomal-protein-alanine N-acetyltransferase|nr:ribosomal protein S18-alanine N-acetyltransferase [Gemmatimonadaceae bacterium]